MLNQASYSSYQLPAKPAPYRFEALRYNRLRWQHFIAAIDIKLLKYAVHGLLWIFLFFLPALLAMPANGDWQLVFAEEFTRVNLISFTGLVVFFYLNYYLFIPRFYLPKSYTVYSIIILASLALFVLAGVHYSKAGFLPGVNYINGLFIVSTLVSIIICQQSGLSKTEAEMAKTKASFLNAQINPHFLFNSLNWIYYLALEQSRQTPGAIVQLSAFMRYLLKDANAETVSLATEIEYIKNYIALQEGKLGHTVHVTYTLPEYTGNVKIAPLLLMSFIENAFKHGVNPDEDSAIRIEISLQNNRLGAQIINNKVTATIKAAGYGMGIENARQRLNLLYPCQHHLDIHEDEKIYFVKLSINLPV